MSARREIFLGLRRRRELRAGSRVTGCSNQGWLCSHFHRSLHNCTPLLHSARCTVAWAEWKVLGLATAQLLEERGAQSLKQEGHTGLGATAHWSIGCTGMDSSLCHLHLRVQSAKCTVHLRLVVKDYSGGGCGTFQCALLLLSEVDWSVQGGLFAAWGAAWGAAQCCSGLRCKYGSGKLECPVWCRTTL